MVDLTKIRNIRKLNKKNLATLIEELKNNGSILRGYVVSGLGSREYHHLNGENLNFGVNEGGLILVKKWTLRELYNLHNLKSSYN